MLKDLDPYTVYYPESDIEDARFLQTGKYGGIGSYVHFKNDTLYVGMPTPGYPFYKAGLRAGDIILKVDDVSTTGKKMSEISELLRGPAGTTLTISYRKAGNPEVKKVTITREQIKIPNVPYYRKLNDSTAYLHLAGFTENAATEVLNALNDMNKDGKIKSLVFDLRGNGGGLLGQAVAIMDLFVPAGELIVSVKGKIESENADYRTHFPAKFPDMKVAVLIDDHSASASEIVAGAFQDLDRAVILGQKSYGKGLVQKIYKLSYNSQVKITVAKYYIPSGRCIQALDYEHKDAGGKATRTADSLQAAFKTKNGRIVKDAGGILPDVSMKSTNQSRLLKSISSKYLIFDYATNYVLNHDSIRTMENFKLDEDVYNDFVAYLKKQGFHYRSTSGLLLKSLEEVAKKEAYYDEVKAELEDLKEEITDLEDQEIQKEKELIKKHLGAEILSRYFFLPGRLSVLLDNDKEVEAAVELLSDTGKYNRILGN